MTRTRPTATLMDRRRARPCRVALLALCCVFCSTPSLSNVFGDGDAANGTEDGRHAAGLGALPAGWQTASGLLHCDGQVRGTATLLDVSANSARPAGRLLATAAHVLVDLETGQRYRQCEFHYMGLGQVAGMQLPVDWAQVADGGFVAGDSPAEPEFGRGDWAFILLPDLRSAIPSGVGLKPLAWSERPAQGEFQVVGYHAGRRQIQASGACNVRESEAIDLGGGHWPGQLLDDCDSGPGASGGGLLVSDGQQWFLVGIRTGAHWDPELYPAHRFPGGPPEGAPWSALHNTNFARAIDHRLIATLDRLVSHDRSKTTGASIAHE